jgi:hypothetical protein
MSDETAPERWIVKERMTVGNQRFDVESSAGEAIGTLVRPGQSLRAFALVLGSLGVVIGAIYVLVARGDGWPASARLAFLLVIGVGLIVGLYRLQPLETLLVLRTAGDAEPNLRFRAVRRLGQRRYEVFRRGERIAGALAQVEFGGTEIRWAGDGQPQTRADGNLNRRLVEAGGHALGTVTLVQSGLLGQRVEVELASALSPERKDGLLGTVGLLLLNPWSRARRVERLRIDDR